MELWTAAGEAVLAAVAELEAAWERLAALPVEGMGVPQVLDGP